MRLFFVLICFAAVACAQTSTPAITSVSPNPIDAGGAAFTLTVNVSSFVSGATINWSGTSLLTTAVNDTTLTATVPAGLIAICGKYSVTLTNAQNAALTPSFAVIVKPVLTSLSPNVLPAGNGGVSLTANGFGFSNNVYLTLLASGTQSNLATTSRRPQYPHRVRPGERLYRQLPRIPVRRRPDHQCRLADPAHHTHCGFGLGDSAR